MSSTVLCTRICTACSTLVECTGSPCKCTGEEEAEQIALEGEDIVLYCGAVLYCTPGYIIPRCTLVEYTGSPCKCTGRRGG